MADGLLGAYFGNPNLQRQGARARALAKQRDVNLLADPKTYAVVQGLLGNAPDQLGFSVLNPKYQEIKQTAEPAFVLGSLLQAAPLLAPMTKGLPVGASIKDVGKFDVVKRDASDIFGAGAKRIKYTEPKSGGVIEVLQKQDGTASVLSLEVPEKFRGKGIGESLQSQVMQDFPEMMGQVSSKAAAKTAYRLGRRPPYEPDATLDDVYKLMDENSSVNLVSPQMQKRFMPELSESVYPQEEAMRLAQQRAALPVEQGGLGLPANNTAMDRAKAMDFDVDLLHGTDKDLTKFEAQRSITKDHGWYGDEGVYLTPDPNTASGYANWKNVGSGPDGKLGQELYGQNVMPLMVRRGNVFDYGDAPPIMDREKAKEFSEIVKRLGYDTVEVPNKYAAPEYSRNYETVVIDPSRIRSRFAAFDPFRKTAATAALMGVAAPDLLAQEVDYTLLPPEKKKELLQSLLGQ